MLPDLKIGLGTWSWANRLVWDYGTAFDESDLFAVYERMCQLPHPLFCTSEGFSDGESERMLGRFSVRSPGKILVASKFIPRFWLFRRSDFQRNLQDSLKRLKRRVIDVYMIMPPNGWMSLRMLAECAVEAVEREQVRDIGVSNFTALQAAKFAEQLSHFGVSLSCIEAQYNLLNREVERNGIQQLCNNLKIPLIAQSPLAMGLLSGKFLAEPQRNGLRRQLMARYPQRGLTGLIRQMNLIGSESQGRNAAQVALNWLIGKGALPIPGATSADQVDENLDCLNWSLNESQMERLDRFSAEMIEVGES